MSCLIVLDFACLCLETWHIGSMSTKIYSGFRFKSCDMSEIHAFILRFRQVAYGVATDYIERVFARAWSNWYDARIVSQHPDCVAATKTFPEMFEADDMTKSASPNTWAVERTEYRFDKKGLDDSGEVVSSVTIFPVFVPLTGTRFIGMFFGSREVENKWIKCKEIESYAYWNNSDKPDDVSWNEWEERKRIWDEVLKNTKKYPFGETPSNAGYSIDFVGQHNLSYMAEFCSSNFARFFPSDDERITSISERVVFCNWLTTTNVVADDKVSHKDGPAGDILYRLNKTFDKEKGLSTWQARIIEARKWARPFVKDLNEEDMFKKFKENRKSWGLQ